MERRLGASRHGSAGFAVVIAAVALMIACGRVASVPQPMPTSQPTPTPSPTPDAEILARVAHHGPEARARLRPHFAAAAVPYPPQRFLLLGLKHERELQLYAAGFGQELRFIRSYAVLGASGTLGPKRREGDRQVPEGIYTIDYLNPRSISHLGLALSYPNPFDRLQAVVEGRDVEDLGGEIMIHGGDGSIGCLAVGDTAAEDLFVLAAETGYEQGVVIISPVDFRRADLAREYRPSAPWERRLHHWLRMEIEVLPLPGRAVGE